VTHGLGSPEKNSLIFLNRGILDISVSSVRILQKILMEM